MGKYDLVGVDGNAHAIMGYTAKALKREGLGNLAEGGYWNLIAVCYEYIQMANKRAEENGWEEGDD